ncbi:macoilin [Anopheles maculipalpis]|uniref:macoilin n=1 Tax=Anopheles maculipalpis TaxID=1496333 RepID=UPI002158E7BC|nr:macoilin [Anopheles maculipalpis]
MKRRNADCGKIRRPIKKNKIAEQIGSNTLLYIKFLLLWASVITADFLLEFRFEFLWPFWLLLRSIYDSYKYKGLAFSVLFVCIAVTSDLVCLFFIPVQWLFFAASTYVWVQYVWHTDKGICLPTIILWILFVYLEAAIRWKDSRNIPHLNLCRPFAAHCIGYPVVTLGFGFKSYVGYRIRQRKQREVAKDNDFYMQLLQEALPKEESKALEPLSDGISGGGAEHPTMPKDLVPVAAMSNNHNSLNSSSSSTATSNRGDTGQHNHHHNHHNHNHHHHNHQQQHHASHSKSTQSYKSPSSSSTVSTTHVNGHVGSGGSSPSSSSSAMNGSLSHSSHQQQGSSKHRKSLDKDSSASSSSTSSNSSSTFNAGSKMNGGSGGSGGSYYFHQTATFQQSGHNSSTSSSSSTSSNSSSSNVGSTTISTKESSITVNRANDHNGSIHCNGSSIAKDVKESTLQQGQTARKDCDRETSNGGNAAASTSLSTSSSAKHIQSNRSKSPNESTPPYSSNGGTLGGTKPNAGKQNGHVAQYHQPELIQQATATEAPTPNTESKGGSGRSGRKNRLKKAAEQQAQLSAIAKLCATLALASSVTTLTTTTAATTTSGGTDKGTTVTPSSYTTASGSGPSAPVKDNLQQNGEQGKDLSNASKGSSCSSAIAEGKQDCSVSSVNGTLKATQTTTGSSCQASSTESAPPAATVIVQKVCESCPRLEGDLKKLRAELSAHRQTENELRQKYDSNANNLKACLQAKQKDYDELQNRYQEHCNQRQQERQNLQTVERRLGEERRHRQSLEAQLNNERKYRKQAEEKAARAECSEACKMKKQQIEMEIDKMQNELHNMEEAKLMAEKQARNYEQELRKMELQLRNRDAQQNTEVLMSALAAMQDKNATLEKSLSAETRFKLDLFSALGGTRREVEILTCSLRAKEEEILDLNAKIVQLLAVMPTENLCLTSHGGGAGSDGGASMMRLADAPQLLPQSMTSGHLNGIGPGSGGSGVGGGVAGGGSSTGTGGSVMQQSSQQQPSPMSHLVQNGPSFCSQLGSLGVLTSTMTTLPSSSVLSGPNTVGNGSGTNAGQIVQMQNSNNGGSSAGNCPSGLDPNATIYTPKNNGGMVGGTEA